MTDERLSEATPSPRRQPRGVHLVGGVPLGSAEDVFRAATSILGGRLRRIPDGETGERINWIGWQARYIGSNPRFEMMPPNPTDYASLPHFKLRSSLSSGEITFEQLGYADAAKASYTVFSQLKQAGLIPTSTRFQVSLPTPLAPVVAFIVPRDQAVVESAYEAAMFAELDQIAAAIPHHELAIQWDVAVEFGDDLTGGQSSHSCFPVSPRAVSPTRQRGKNNQPSLARRANGARRNIKRFRAAWSSRSSGYRIGLSPLLRRCRAQALC